MAEERANRGSQQAEADEQNRTPRDMETRASTAQAEDTWSPPELLPEVQPRPGWVHRWIRTSIMGNPDNQNVSTRFREGWEAAPAEEYPEFSTLVDTTNGWGKKGCIEIGGLMLCRAPASKMAARERWHQDKSQAQMTAVESQLMSESDARMPMERPDIRTKTTFGSR